MVSELEDHITKTGRVEFTCNGCECIPSKVFLQNRWKAKSLQLVGFLMADLEVFSFEFLGLQSIKAVKVENVSSFYMKHRSVRYFQSQFHCKHCFVKKNRKL